MEHYAEDITSQKELLRLGLPFPVLNFIVILLHFTFAPSGMDRTGPGGGIGRRSRLKICRSQECAGSIPVSGTSSVSLGLLLAGADEAEPVSMLTAASAFDSSLGHKGRKRKSAESSSPLSPSPYVFSHSFLMIYLIVFFHNNVFCP